MKWVLIDISYLTYRAFYSVGDLSFEDVPTGIIFGFFSQLRQICLDPRVRSNKIAIFRDSRTSLRATKTFSAYKEKRRTERTPEEIKTLKRIHSSVDELTKEILPEIGFVVYEQEGLESDDLIAKSARTISKDPSSSGVIISADGDLYQCISPNIHWFDPQRNLYHTPNSFLVDKGIDASNWGEVKAISGCDTDNVPGVPGVGWKTAVKFINGELPIRYKTHQAITSGEGQKTIKRNRELVVLPHKETKPISLKEPHLNPDNFLYRCEGLGMASFIKEEGSWRSFFHGAPFKTRRVERRLSK
jgi:DNA polymerase I